MKIPKSFKLFGQTINVEYSNNLIKDEDKLGMACYRYNKIILQKSTEGYELEKGQTEETFLHELMHFIFYFSDNKDLSENENAVNIVARLLYQFIKTSEGELK